MFRIAYAFTFVFTLLLFTTHAQEKTGSSAKKINYAKEGYVKAKIIKYEVESCGFLIELADKEKTKLSPDKLAEDFKKNNLKVWVKFVPVKKQMMGTCMAGKQCEMVDIRRRK